MKKIIKKSLVMLAGLAGACGVYAADVWWPTGPNGNGLTGDMSSKSETGWNNETIDFSVGNRWILGQPGSYSVQLFGKEMSMEVSKQGRESLFLFRERIVSFCL